MPVTLGTYLGCPEYTGILRIQGFEVPVTLGMHLRCPEYPGVLSISTSTCGMCSPAHVDIHTLDYPRMSQGIP